MIGRQVVVAPPRAKFTFAFVSAGGSRPGSGPQRRAGLLRPLVQVVHMGGVFFESSAFLLVSASDAFLVAGRSIFGAGWMLLSLFLVSARSFVSVSIHLQSGQRWSFFRSPKRRGTGPVLWWGRVIGRFVSRGSMCSHLSTILCLVELLRWLLHVVIGGDVLYEGVDPGEH